MSTNKRKTKYLITFCYQGWQRQLVELDKPMTKKQLLTKLEDYKWLVSLEEKGTIVDGDTYSDVAKYSNVKGEVEVDTFNVEEIE